MVICPKFQRGFSLTELLTVIAILGLSVSIVVPNLSNIYASLTSKLERDEVIDLFNQLGDVAYYEKIQVGESTFTKGGSLDHYFPSDWSVEGNFVFSRNGACRGGNVTFSFSSNEIFNEVLLPPFCQVEKRE